MTDSANITVVRRFYGNLGSPEILTQVLSPTIRWEIVPGFPYGGVYLGMNAVFQEFFGRVLQDFEEWRTEMSELFDAADARVHDLARADLLLGAPADARGVLYLLHLRGAEASQALDHVGVEPYASILVLDAWQWLECFGDAVHGHGL